MESNTYSNENYDNWPPYVHKNPKPAPDVETGFGAEAFQKIRLTLRYMYQLVIDIERL